MKLMFSEPFAPGSGMGLDGPYVAWYRQVADTVANPGTTLDFTILSEEYFASPVGPYTITYNAIGIVQNAYRAEKNGYDAFIIGCAMDAGLQEARGLVNIPVVAATESASHLASILGNKFSIITLEPSGVKQLKNIVQSYGLGDKLASVRFPSSFIEHEPYELMSGGEEGERKFVEIATAEMSKAVAEDGAEALILGCTCGGSLLTVRGIFNIDGAPVIDPVVAVIKTAETLVELQKACGISVCKASIYGAPLPGWEKEVPIKVD